MVKKRRTFHTTFNTFSEVGVIGQGGSARVLEATDIDGTVFAIKLLNVKGTPRSKLKRFENEIHFCEKTDHLNIVKVIDHGPYKDGDNIMPFYVMKKYDCTLRDLINQGIPTDRVLSIFGSILDGIEAAHLLGVVHRDIKPENILCTKNADEIVVSDFGISHFHSETILTAVETKDGERLANFQYAAPEQRIRSGIVDHRADIYALGLILNEMYTDKIPIGTKYKAVSVVAPEFQYLDEIVETMISQDPEVRFQSIEKIKNELIAREQRFILLQQLSKRKQTVIKESELDDSILSDPIRVVGVDWDKGTLSITLNQAVNPKWTSALQNIGSHTSVPRKGPEMFRFRGNVAFIGCESDDAQRVINYFKNWLPKANQRYELTLKQEKERKIAENRRRLKEDIRAKEERKNLLDNLEI